MLKKITVLITGAGAPGAPGIIKSLKIVQEREVRVIGVDSNIKTAIGSALADKVYNVPLATESEFINVVLDICLKEKVDVVIPLVTKELFVFSKYLSFFEKNNIKIQVSKLESLLIANNKYELMKFCKLNDIPVPEFHFVNTLNDFEQKAKLLGYPEKTICFKPPISNGLRGFRIINDSSDKMDSLINDKPNNVYLGYSEFIQIAKDSKYFPDLLLMEFLPGDEYSVDCLVDNGKCLAVIPRTRELIKMGISFVGTVVNDKQIIEYSKICVEKLGLNGNIGLQFKRDIKGIPKLIESNPRVQGTIILSTAAGYNMVYNSVKTALNEKITNKNILWNTKMIRFWDEVFFDSKGHNFRL